ncbi:MAG: hypothetical protein K2G04_06235, partial [Oscillospiraceae bacterium]|nr:hypothetical protein [Oscillospiraceae bacterium]
KFCKDDARYSDPPMTTIPSVPARAVALETAFLRFETSPLTNISASLGAKTVLGANPSRQTALSIYRLI